MLNLVRVFPLPVEAPQLPHSQGASSYTINSTDEKIKKMIAQWEEFVPDPSDVINTCRKLGERGLQLIWPETGGLFFQGREGDVDLTDDDCTFQGLQLAPEGMPSVVLVANDLFFRDYIWLVLHRSNGDVQWPSTMAVFLGDLDCEYPEDEGKFSFPPAEMEPEMQLFEAVYRQEEDGVTIRCNENRPVGSPFPPQDLGKRVASWLAGESSFIGNGVAASREMVDSSSESEDEEEISTSLLYLEVLRPLFFDLVEKNNRLVSQYWDFADTDPEKKKILQEIKDIRTTIDGQHEALHDQCIAYFEKHPNPTYNSKEKILGLASFIYDHLNWFMGISSTPNFFDTRDPRFCKEVLDPLFGELRKKIMLLLLR